jgi:diketogulonate reductase-like aldo/keto reductase
VLAEANVPREDLFIQTKFVTPSHHRPFTPPYPLYGHEKLEDVCQLSLYRSLEHLQTMYVDAFLVNAPELPAKPMTALLQTLLNLKDRGIVRYTGICNVATVEILEHLHNSAPRAIDIVQNPLHSHWDSQYRIPQYCRSNGIHYHTFHTLTSSDRIIKDPSLLSISTETGVTPQVVFLQYCIQSGMTPLVGATNTDHLRADLPLANSQLPPLTQSHLKLISRLMAEQIVINVYRGASFYENDRISWKRENGREKMKMNQEKQTQDSVIRTLTAEQEIVEKAKARIKALEDMKRGRVRSESFI